MNSSHPNEPLAKSVELTTDGLLFVKLADGRVIAARYDVFPRLKNASEKQRNNWRLIGEGVGIHWPEIDEDLSTEGLLRDALLVAPAPGIKRNVLTRARAAGLQARRSRKAIERKRKVIDRERV